MKSYTDLEQSKKLANILPIESADMYYQYVLPKSSKIKHNPEIGNPENALKWYNKGYTTFGKEPITLDEYCIPCWSLAALIELIPDECRMEKTPLDQTGEFTYSFVDDYYNIRTYEEGNPVDACYEMILKFYELNLL